MYGIFIEFNENCLKNIFNSNKERNEFYLKLKEFMKKNNFIYKNNSLYISKNNINSVETIITVQKLVQNFFYIKNCIKTVEMLNIKEISDLIPAIKNI